MNELIEAVADLLRGGIVIEKDGENAVRIRLEGEAEQAEQPKQEEGTRLSW